MSQPPTPPPTGPEPIVEETDPRFPSGPWTGFFLMDHWPDRHKMDLHLSFRQGTMTGEGRDRIGSFLIRGKYNLDDGKCHWSKRYVGLHDVAYQGFNEGKGIWGIWEIPPTSKGGFHIWPEAMGDPTQPKLAESAAPPAEVPAVPEPEGVEVGAGSGAAEPIPVGVHPTGNRVQDSPGVGRLSGATTKNTKGTKRERILGVRTSLVGWTPPAEASAPRTGFLRDAEASGRNHEKHEIHEKKTGGRHDFRAT